MDQAIDILTYIAIGAFIGVMLFEWRQRIRQHAMSKHEIKVGSSSIPMPESVPTNRGVHRTHFDLPETGQIKRLVILWFAIASAMTWSSGYGSVYNSWQPDRLNVTSALALAFIPAIVFEGIAEYFERCRAE